MSEGGKGGFNIANKGKTLEQLYGFKIAAKIKDICSKTHSGKMLTQEQKEAISVSHTGKVLSKETREKISKAHKGRIFTSEWCQKISEAKKKQIFTDETKEKIKQTLFRKSEEKLKPILNGLLRDYYSYKLPKASLRKKYSLGPVLLNRILAKYPQ
jgi:hypothetical protein